VFGEHNAEVLGMLGHSAEEIEEFGRIGVVARSRKEI